MKYRLKPETLSGKWDRSMQGRRKRIRRKKKRSRKKRLFTMETAVKL